MRLRFFLALALALLVFSVAQAQRQSKGNNGNGNNGNGNNGNGNNGNGNGNNGNGNGNNGNKNDCLGNKRAQLRQHFKDEEMDAICERHHHWMKKGPDTTRMERLLQIIDPSMPDMVTQALLSLEGHKMSKSLQCDTGHVESLLTESDGITTERSKAPWELRKNNIGVYAIQGRRPHMEDRFNVVSDLEHTETSIYGIFDGHGGEFAADFSEKTLLKTIMVRLLKSALDGTKEQFGQILTEEILNVDKQLLEIERLTNEVSGTTALVALLRGNKLSVANVGDSRGVMCDQDGNAIPLSFDHKPQQLKERKRIEKAGGFISFNGVWRVAGVLAMSRALGDYPLKEKNLVIAEPDILNFDLDNLKPKFMILATDGLWDAFSNEEAVKFVQDHVNEPDFGAKSLVLQAYQRGSLDNITVMVVNFLQSNTTSVRQGTA